jgi:hypothetical protein
MTTIRLTGETQVCDLLTRHPQTFAIFESHGMCAECKAAPPPVPLQHFSERHGVPLAQLLAELADAIGQR